MYLAATRCASVFSDKFDITKHPNYRYLSDADPKNAFDMEKHIKRRPVIVKPDEVFDYYELTQPI